MSDVLDRHAVLSHFGGDAELIQEIAGLFQQSSREWLAQMRAALVQGDAEQLRRTAHTLKGSSGNFLASNVAAAARRVEELARAGNLAEAPAALAALELLLDRLHAALANWVAELRGAPKNDL